MRKTIRKNMRHSVKENIQHSIKDIYIYTVSTYVTYFDSLARCIITLAEDSLSITANFLLVFNSCSL